MGIIGKPKLERLIKDMAVGELGYTVPWALIFDENETPYLQVDFPIMPFNRGTLKMPVKKITPERNGYEINLNFAYERDNEYVWNIIPREEILRQFKPENIVILDSSVKNADLSEEGKSPQLYS